MILDIKFEGHFFPLFTLLVFFILPMINICFFFLKNIFQNERLWQDPGAGQDVHGGWGLGHMHLVDVGMRRLARKEGQSRSRKKRN